MNPPTALSIAGSDSSGGAGIQADIRTMAAFGVFCATAVTSVTVQNTESVRSAHHLPPDVVAAQIDAVMDDLGATAAKTGMLPTGEIILAVADRIRARRISPLVVDPVMVATSGGRLMAAEALEALRGKLLPLATLVTPNLDEAAALSGIAGRAPDDLERAARIIRDMGAQNVLVKGGHLQGDATDLFFDGRRFERLTAPRSGSRPVHGAGCTLSAAVVSGLARGWDLETAVRRAKEYVSLAIGSSIQMGRGSAVVNTLTRPRDSGPTERVTDGRPA